MDEILEFALHLARGAGERLREGFGKVERDDVAYKGWRNLVTEYDLAVESWVRQEIHRRYPEHGILAEEGLFQKGTTSYNWIIDPLDGTTNYVHHHPMYCVSIALCDEAGILLGVVYAPQLDEMFSAFRGRGALMNGVRAVRVSQEADLSHGLLSSGFAYREGELVNSNLENWNRLSLVCRGLRRCGAAALDLAYVADGRYDGFWELYLSPWDVAAGALLVTEAGGKVTDGAGGDDWLYGTSVVASNGALHEEIRRHLQIE